MCAHEQVSFVTCATDVTINTAVTIFVCRSRPGLRAAPASSLGYPRGHGCAAFGGAGASSAGRNDQCSAPYMPPHRRPPPLSAHHPSIPCGVQAQPLPACRAGRGAQ
eukprot:scaffold8106_cov403-Prasinococcus_capsulatus_cf.AAC.6